MKFNIRTFQLESTKAQDGNPSEELKKPTRTITTLESEESDLFKYTDNEDNFVSDPSKSSATTNSTIEEIIILKIPPLTWYYWCEKMTATTFGETFADFWSQTLGLGYSSTSATLISIFAVFLLGQLYVKRYVPPLFWAVMATSSIAGTLISDFIDRSLGWGYPLGMSVLLSILIFILGVWKWSGLHMNVAGAMNRKQEALYWSAILVSNTLGTALGDFLADSLEWGFAIAAGTIGGILVVCAGLAMFSKCNKVFLFWVAFILTRPFGASFGDLLTKSKEAGGLDLGTGKASLVIFILFLVAFAYEIWVLHKSKMAKAEESRAAENDVVIDDSCA